MVNTFYLKVNFEISGIGFLKLISRSTTRITSLKVI